MNIFVNNISMLIVKKRLGLQTSCLLFETFYRNNGIKSKKKQHYATSNKIPIFNI